MVLVVVVFWGFFFFFFFFFFFVVVVVLLEKSIPVLYYSPFCVSIVVYCNVKHRYDREKGWFTIQYSRK